MTVNLVSHTTILGTGGGAGPFTSSAIDTTTAGLLIRAAACGFFNGPSLSDNKGNPWNVTFRAESDGVGNFQLDGHSQDNPIVGAGHTFTIGGGGSSDIAECIAAFSGIPLTPKPNDQSNGNRVLPGLTIQAGSITPTTNGQLIIAAVAFWPATGSTSPVLSIDSGFTIINQIAYSVSNYYGVALAWKQQGTAAAINPTWTADISSNLLAVIGSFVSIPGGAQNFGCVIG